MSAVIDITLPRLHAGQARVDAEAARFNVLGCGRRWGKTLFGLERMADPLLDGLPVAWFAPTYKFLQEVWSEARKLYRPITARVNATEKRIDLINGAAFEFWTLDGPDGKDAGRGRKYARVVVDEAAMVGHLEAAWTEAIRPTLTDYEGDAYFLSTPKGRNYFWRCYERGQDPLETEWASWSMPTATNPHIVPAEIDAARKELPDRVFRQEYLAEFLDDGGGVFRRVREAATAERQPQAQDGHEYVMGVDWGRHNDFTVLTVYDLTADAVADVDRFTGIEYERQLTRLRAMHRRFNCRAVVAELNSMGGPLVEQLQSEGLPVTGFNTTNESKTAVVRELERLLEEGAIRLLSPDACDAAPVVVAELDAYEQDRLPSGRWKFGAPEGMHDDAVMSLALAVYAATQKPARTKGGAMIPGL